MQHWLKGALLQRYLLSSLVVVWQNSSGRKRSFLWSCLWPWKFEVWGLKQMVILDKMPSVEWKEQWGHSPLAKNLRKPMVCSLAIISLFMCVSYAHIGAPYVYPCYYINYLNSFRGFSLHWLFSFSWWEAPFASHLFFFLLRKNPLLWTALSNGEKRFRIEWISTPCWYLWFSKWWTSFFPGML